MIPSWISYIAYNRVHILICTVQVGHRSRLCILLTDILILYWKNVAVNGFNNLSGFNGYLHFVFCVHVALQFFKFELNI